jgi:hypothetical protein
MIGSRSPRDGSAHALRGASMSPRIVWIVLALMYGASFGW